MVQGTPERKVGVALVELRANEERYFTDPAQLESVSSAEPAETNITIEALSRLSADGPAVELPAVASSSQATDGGSRVIPNEIWTPGAGRPQRGVGGQGHTSLFGAEGVGTRFVYVLDRSGSMNGFNGRPLAAAKAELLASLAQLDKVHQFQIVFYNEHPHVFNPYAPRPPQLMFADEQGKRLAEQFVQGITAGGGSFHYAALRLALQMQPDVIFFLTDGQENTPTESQLDQLLRQARRAGTTIHAIEFGAGPRRTIAFLSRLASATGGQYVYVDVTRLGL